MSWALWELKTAQSEYRGMVDEATKVVFYGKELDFILQVVVELRKGS